MLEEVIKNFNLPVIPSCKIPYSGLRSLETDAIFKSQDGEKLTERDISVLEEVVSFYEILFPALKKIELSNLTLDEGIAIQRYLDQAVNYTQLIRNDMWFDQIFRVSIIDESFREKGKVRSTKFLKYPPIEIVRECKKYNRANAFNRTAFYAAAHWHIALQEVKPQIGQKIIMSVWEPKSGEIFNSYPITNDKSKQKTELTDGLSEFGAHHHPLHNKLSALLMDFLVSEFTKDVKSSHPNHIEYLFSAYFSESILGPIIADTKEEECDIIRYPTVAFGHILDNIVMTPHCLNSRMEIVHAVEFEVEETYYDKVKDLETSPAKLKFIREANWFEGDMIIWED